MLELGKTYKRSDGKMVTCISKMVTYISTIAGDHYFLCNDTLFYYPDGTCTSNTFSLGPYTKDSVTDQEYKIIKTLRVIRSLSKEAESVLERNTKANDDLIGLMKEYNNA